MNNGIGEGRTRKDHREWANQLYAAYATGRDLRKLVAIIGEEALTEIDRKYLKFAERFEKEMIGQGLSDRSIDQTLDLGWDLLSLLPVKELKRINKDHIHQYYHGETMEKMYGKGGI